MSIATKKPEKNPITTKSKSKTTSVITGRAKTMADLLTSVRSSFVTFKKGDVVKGTIKKLTPSEILVDVNAKTEAVVLEKDRRILKTLLSELHEGEEVEVSILNPESETGNPVVSLRRFIDELIWKRLSDLEKNQKPIEVVVTETTRGGLIANNPAGLSGFLPQSQMLLDSSLSDVSIYDQSMIGKKLTVFVSEVARSTRKIIFSQKPSVSPQDFDKAIKGVSIGQQLETTVTNVTPFGVFVSVRIDEKSSLDGLIHISEISWEKVVDLASIFTSSQKITAVVIGFDRDARRMDLSIKRLTKDPFAKIAASFSVDQKVKGTVKEVLSSGIIIELVVPESEDSVDGFIRKEKIPPTVTYKTGDTITATVSQVDVHKHRIVLTPVLLEKPIGYR